MDNDQGSPAYTETGTWTTSGSTGYNGGTYRFATAGGSHTATWKANLGSGIYEVSVIYRTGSNRTTSTKYVVHASNGDQVVYVNQTVNNLVWVSLGSFTFNAGDNTITLDAAGSSGGSVVIADAVKFTYQGAPTPTPTPTPVPDVIKDNDDGSPTYTETGTWTTSGSTGYNGGTYRFATVGGAHTATWNLDLPVAGSWTISVIYKAGTNRATSAKYVVQTSSGAQTVYKNQQQNDLVWVTLGTWNFNAGAGSVKIDAAGSSGGSVVIADAVKAEKQ